MNRRVCQILIIRDFPDFVVNNTPRPVLERKTFTTWKFYGKVDQPERADLLGSVRLVASERPRLHLTTRWILHL